PRPRPPSLSLHDALPISCGVELRGGANDVAGLDYLDPRHLVTTVDGAVLGGGSRFGEEAIYGVMRWLEERGVGFAAGPTVVPHRSEEHTSELQSLRHLVC